MVEGRDGEGRLRGGNRSRSRSRSKGRSGSKRECEQTWRKMLRNKRMTVISPSFVVYEVDQVR